MALVNARLAWPPSAEPFGTSNLSSFLIDAAAEKVAFVFQCPKAGDLNSVGFRLGTVTQAPTNGLKVSFQDVSVTTGAPDGTADQYATVTAGLTSNTWVDVSATGYMGSTGAGSGTKRTVAQGEWLAVVIEYASFSASDSLNISGWPSAPQRERPYLNFYTSSWTKQPHLPVMTLKYDDGTYASSFFEYGVPFSALTTLTISSSTDPDEAGLYFQVPFDCVVDGGFMSSDADGDCDCVLYDSDGSTVLASVSLDKDIRGNTSETQHSFLFSSAVNLSADTYYRLVMKPTSATSVTVRYFDVAAAALLDQMDGGQTCHWTQRTDGGAWAQTTTRRPVMAVLISQIDIGSAGGGLPILGGSVVR